MLLPEHFIYNIVEFDYNILFEFLSEEDKKSFMVWDNCILNMGGDSIEVVYRAHRAPFFKRCLIPLIEYELKLKEKNRNDKLNELGI
jgi:hypothetical protein